MQQQMFFDVSQAADRETFERRLLNFAEALDFGLVNAWLVTENKKGPADIEYVGNRPDGMIEASNDPVLVQSDPVLQRLHHESLPFIYNRKTYTDCGKGDLADFLGQYGYRSGVTVALHLPASKHFILSFSREQALPKSEDRVTSILANLQLAAVHAQVAAQRLLLPTQSVITNEQRSRLTERARDDVTRFAGRDAEHLKGVHLTPREQEILQWTMHGKSGTVVADILGVSHAVVKFHLANAMTKLNAPTKHAAVMKAVSLGLL